MDIHYRHEWKHEINMADLYAIRARLKVVARGDPHAKDGKYFIRSLYFDNLSDKALREKIDGVDRREKFRIRYYNKDTSFIRLEKKSKVNGLETKYSAPNIRTGLTCTDFLNPNCVTIPAGDPIVIMEVKWDEFLPSIIKSAVQMPGRRVTAFSKYAQCRIYG